MRAWKPAALAALLLGALLAPASPAHAANIVTNPGFESGLSGWTCSATSGAQAVTTPVHGGTRALQATPAGSDTARCQQTVAVQPGQAYTLSAWVRGGYVFLGATGTGINASTWGSPGAAWSQLTTSFTTGTGVTSVTVHVNGWYGQGAYHADDIVLDGPPGQGQPPAVPTGLTGTGGMNQARLTWTAVTGATGYNVFRNGTRVGSATEAAYTDNPSPGTHSYRVSATNAAGESAQSAAVSVTVGNDVPPPPPAPTGLTGSVSGSAVSLAWNAAPTATGYHLYRGTARVSTVTGTSATDSPGPGTHTYHVRAFHTSGVESAASNQATVTVAGNPGTLPKRVMVGYLHASFANGSGYIRMADVPNEWDVINLAFGEPTSVTSGDIRFRQCPVAECPNVESEADFIAGIRAKQALGKKVLISIGGQNGQVQLTTTAARDAFVSSVSAIIDRYGLDGLDIDFEGHSLYLNAGDTNLSAPTTPVIVNLIAALRTLKARYGTRFVLTMAPETFFVQLGYQFYGPGTGGADSRSASYLPVIHAMRNDLTLLHVQDYNSGPIMGLDNQYHTMGTHDFHVAMTDMLLAGFPIRGDVNNVFPALRQDQVAIGLPAAPWAGNGFTTVAEVQKAFDCLAKGTNCGPYRPRGVYPNLRGLMTWSINWDKYNGFEFSRGHRAYLNALG
ncbi:MAG: chitinase [Thermoactinospora sp.]|nr:chitinase [Thermoactinospora sp.]